jgi:hypothetical protein
MSNGFEAFESVADDVATRGPEAEFGETPVTPELRAALVELDKHLQSFLREHNSAERPS